MRQKSPIPIPSPSPSRRPRRNKYKCMSYSDLESREDDNPPTLLIMCQTRITIISGCWNLTLTEKVLKRNRFTKGSQRSLALIGSVKYQSLLRTNWFPRIPLLLKFTKREGCLSLTMMRGRRNGENVWMRPVLWWYNRDTSTSTKCGMSAFRWAALTRTTRLSRRREDRMITPNERISLPISTDRHMERQSLRGPPSNRVLRSVEGS